MSIKEADRVLPVTTRESDSTRERRSVLRPSRIRLYEPLVIGTLSVVLALTVWQLVANARIWSVLFLPGPWDVAQAFVQLFQSDDIWLDIATSGEELAIGYGMAIVIGLLIGLLMGWYTRFQYALDPFVNFFYSTPRIVFIPIFILWLGIELQPKIAVIFLGAVFPIIINTMAGVRNTEAALLRVARSFGASDALTFRRVVLPGSVPFILTGFRLLHLDEKLSISDQLTPLSDTFLRFRGAAVPRPNTVADLWASVAVAFYVSVFPSFISSPYRSSRRSRPASSGGPRWK